MLKATDPLNFCLLLLSGGVAAAASRRTGGKNSGGHLRSHARHRKKRKKEQLIEIQRREAGRDSSVRSDPLQRKTADPPLFPEGVMTHSRSPPAAGCSLRSRSVQLRVH